MKIDKIRRIIKELAKSQGSYSKLDRSLTELQETDEEKYDEVVAELESQHFKDSIDLIMYLEG